METTNFKEKAFGSTKKEVEAKHGFKPSKTELEKPLSAEAEIRVFCTGCGAFHEFKKGSMDYLGSLISQEIPENLEEYFFETSACFACDSKREGGELKKIKEVEN